MRIGQKIRNRHPVMVTTHMKNVPFISYHRDDINEGKHYNRDEEKKYRKKQWTSVDADIPNRDNWSRKMAYARPTTSQLSLFADKKGCVSENRYGGGTWLPPIKAVIAQPGRAPDS